MLTSGYLAASPPEKLNVTFCVIQHTKGMRDINYWWYFWNCPWGHLSGPFRSPWFSEVQRFLSSRRVKEQCLHEYLSPTHFWQIHAHKKDPEGTLIWPIIFHTYRLSDPSFLLPKQKDSYKQGVGLDLWRRTETYGHNWKVISMQSKLGKNSKSTGCLSYHHGSRCRTLQWGLCDFPTAWLM